MRNFDDIIPPSKRKETESPQRDLHEPVRVQSRRSFRFPYITVLVALIVIAGSVGAMFYFASAEVVITPDTQNAPIQNSFTANLGNGNALSFEVISAQKMAMQDVVSSGNTSVTASASGSVTIYNTQPKPQRLIATTRFASANGLIYRIHTAVTVPAGSASAPGTITATVTADQPGSSYNIGPSSFTVPGLAGTPLATKVYAQSTQPITGGASGTEPIVDPTVATNAHNALVSALTPALVDALRRQVPSGYILLPGAATTTFQDLAPTTASSTGKASLRVQGTVTAVVFPAQALAAAIASSTPSMAYQGSPIQLATSTGLSMTPLGAFPSASSQSFTFSLSGTAQLTYVVQTGQIAAAVAGKSRSAAKVALTNFPEVKNAILVLHPFWRTSFPQDPSAITVRVSAPK